MHAAFRVGRRTPAAAGRKPAVRGRDTGAVAQQNTDLVRRMLDAFNGGDVDAVLATFTDDCVLREPPEMPDSPAEGFQGHDGIRT
jgi:hypothetical protein